MIEENNNTQIEKDESVEKHEDDIPNPFEANNNNNNTSDQYETVSQYLENENNHSHILQSHYDDNSITNDQEKIQRLFHYEVVDREVQTEDLPQSHTSIQTEIQSQERPEDNTKADLQTISVAEKSIAISSSSLLQRVSEQNNIEAPNVEKMTISSLPFPPAPTSSPIPPNLPDQNVSNPSVPEDFKISFMNFSIGDIALFVPIDEKKSIWMAFHSSRPYRFLAQVSFINLHSILSNSNYILCYFCRNRWNISYRKIVKKRKKIHRINLVNDHAFLVVLFILKHSLSMKLIILINCLCVHVSIFVMWSHCSFLRRKPLLKQINRTKITL